MSISDADRDPSLDYVATVYNGIRLADFTFRPKPGEYAVVLGRIHPDKGVPLAIEAATAAGMPLIIAGIVQDTDYFRRHVEPRLDGDRVRFLGPVWPAERDSLLGGALALLHLVTFDEPFGLAMIEAMACGTPVIGMRRGAVPEVVVDGRRASWSAMSAGRCGRSGSWPASTEVGVERGSKSASRSIRWSGAISTSTPRCSNGGPAGGIEWPVTAQRWRGDRKRLLSARGELLAGPDGHVLVGRRQIA